MMRNHDKPWNLVVPHDFEDKTIALAKESSQNGRTLSKNQQRATELAVCSCQKKKNQVGLLTVIVVLCQGEEINKTFPSRFHCPRNLTWKSNPVLILSWFLDISRRPVDHTCQQKMVITFQTAVQSMKEVSEGFRNHELPSKGCCSEDAQCKEAQSRFGMV